ncbi:HAMP domain-containing protein, partial [Catenovulum sp. SM1970]|uniref:methyl-accepting chemotaxis protein n=1 Tax=Marinifaba aquimaris TaxID=2741323 RepID=UPI001574E0C4
MLGLKNMTLASKLIFSFITFAIIPMLVVGFTAQHMSSNIIHELEIEKLATVKETRKQAVENYINGAVNDLEAMAERTDVIAAMQQFNETFYTAIAETNTDSRKLTEFKQPLSSFYNNEFGSKFEKENRAKAPLRDMLSLSDEAIFFQHQYIAANPHPLGEKNNLNTSSDDSRYSSVHSQYHSVFNSTLQRYGYYDIFLIKPDTGHIVYSVFKELDFATSLKYGPYRDTNFADTYREVLARKQTVIKDYQAYLPSYNAPALFIGSPILKNGQVIGVLVYQLPYEEILEIMTPRVGLGETGDSYLYGADLLPRSDSSLGKEAISLTYAFKEPAKAKLTGTIYQDSLSQKVGYEITQGYDGKEVFASFAKLDIRGLDWRIMVTIETEEAFAAISDIFWTVAILCLAVLIIVSLFGFTISKSISRPIKDISNLLEDLSTKGQFDLRSQYQSKNEVGVMSAALNKLLSNLQVAFKDISQVLTDTSQGVKGHRVNETFAGDINTLATNVNNAVEMIEESAKQASTEQANAKQQAEKALKAAEEAAQSEQEAEVAKQNAIESAEHAEALAAQAKQLAEQAEQEAQASTRVKTALDKCQANVMMLNTELNVTYLNDSIITLMRKNGAQLQNELIAFDASRLIGQSFSIFFKGQDNLKEHYKNLSKVYQSRLEVAGLTFDLTATPVFDDSNNRLGTVIEWQDMTQILAQQEVERVKHEQEQRLANENARIKQALDNVSTNTLIADADNKIIYMNDAIDHMMKTAESDICSVIPSFNAKNIMGNHIDVFEQSPAHRQNALATTTSTYSTELEIGGRTFKLVANPIVADDGTRIGTVVEWGDRTEEVAVEKEIDNLVDKAAAGDLSVRMNLDNKDGFFKGLGDGLNRLVDVCDGVINDTVEMLDAMAHGNLTKRIEGDYQGAFGKLKEDANATVTKLTEIIARVNQSANTVASGADEIAQGNADLSQRTEEQASSLEETASSMEEMTSTVKQNADNAQIANQLASDAQTKAVQGGEVVERAVTGMSEINDSSKKIADIIGVIDEIAFQTNLLALNAAVEAARAGEQGRGFAVVAGEVRNLAQRSAEAAKEIKDLIRDSVAKVEDGS